MQLVACYLLPDVYYTLYRRRRDWGPLLGSTRSSPAAAGHSPLQYHVPCCEKGRHGNTNDKRQGAKKNGVGQRRSPAQVGHDFSSL
jgi:hypothetical protein